MPIHIGPGVADPLGNDAWLGVTLSGGLVHNSALNMLDLCELSSSRNCGEALKFLRRCNAELIKSYEPHPIPFSSDASKPLLDISRPQQRGDLVYIPQIRGGVAIIVSDIEGDANLVHEICKRERIIERLSQNKVDEQVFFISLGDAIDRQGYRASDALEFLLNLKFEYGFRDNIHILAGNHELSPEIQLLPHHGGFFREVVDYRSSYSIPGEIPPELQEEAVAWFETLFLSKLPSTAAPYRVALWREFNNLFSYSPKTVVTANGLVLCHGGPSDSGAFSFLREPNEWPRPTFEEAITWLTNIPFDIERYTEEEREHLAGMHHATVEDITWSDWRGHVIETEPNMSRRISADGELLPLGIYYGPAALERYLSVLGARVMIRGHQKMPPDGATNHSPNVWSVGDSLLTINSNVPSSAWVKRDNGACGGIIENKRSYLEVDLGKPIRGIEDIKIHEL